MVGDVLFKGTDEDLERLVKKIVLSKIPEEDRESVGKRVNTLLQDYNGREVDVLSIMAYAAEKDRVDEYISKLSEFYKKDLQFVHPEARRNGHVPGALRAEQFVLGCYKEMNIKPRDN